MKKLTMMVLAILLVITLPMTAFAAEAVQSVRDMIEALPTVEEFKAMDSDAQVDAYNRTQYAYDAYMALSGEEKAELEGAEEIFDALFSHYNTLIAPAAEESGKTGSNTLVWVILAALAAMVLVPGLKKKTT